MKIEKVLLFVFENISLYRIRYQKIFFNGNKRDKTKAHDSKRVALLRLKDGQAEQNKLSVPRGQNPEYAGVLQNTNGILF